VGKTIRKVEEPADEIRAQISPAEPGFTIGFLTFGVGWGLNGTALDGRDGRAWGRAAATMRRSA
jgi:hypothetical protein